MKIKTKKVRSFDSMKISKQWNFGVAKEDRIHKIHTYPAKFPSFITTKSIEYAKSKKIEIDSIADVFCGCGTTSYEAKKNNKNFYGFDINPVATLIAKTKSNKYSNKKLLKLYQNILETYNNIEIDYERVNLINERIKYWYYDSQIYNLLKLKESIQTVLNKKGLYYNFFMCAFSNILKPTSKWLTKSIKPQIDPLKNKIDVISKFKSQFEFMLKANEESNLKYNTKSKINNINFLDIDTNKIRVDMIITSPPYVTSYEYADLHQLSTLWLDYCNDYREFRNGTIGSLYHSLKENILNDSNKIDSLGSRIVFELYNNQSTKALSVLKYFIDMKKCVNNCYKILNNNGIIFFVIGNTIYKNTKIRNAEYLTNCMLESNFKDIDVYKRNISSKILPLYRDNKGRFSSNTKSKKIYADEYIIIGRKYEN